jgi:hypothetical protein
MATVVFTAFRISPWLILQRLASRLGAQALWSLTGTPCHAPGDAAFQQYVLDELTIIAAGIVHVQSLLFNGQGLCIVSIVPVVAPPQMSMDMDNEKSPLLLKNAPL